MAAVTVEEVSAQRPGVAFGDAYPRLFAEAYRVAYRLLLAGMAALALGWAGAVRP